jgi:starch-binding outer membrane protein, SusD/RagB family
MQKHILFGFTLLAIWFLSVSCEDLNIPNNNSPGRNSVITTGADLVRVLDAGYVYWWQAVHGEHPVMAVSVAADAYGLSWDDFGCRRMGEEPRQAYNNRAFEDSDYKNIVEIPWYGCLAAVSNANDVIAALKDGVTIDNGGPQDKSVRAAAHFLRGVSWGYLGLVFDQALVVDEDTDLTKEITFSSYEEMIAPAVDELDEAASLAASAGNNFIHKFFNGLTLSDDQFIRLCRSYAARFLAQWPRTATENIQVDWQAVLDHAEEGIQTDFAPLADGRNWVSYHRYAFAETGQGPFWARVDQRLVAALDPSQPARYPEVIAQGEAPLANPMASSADKRLETDFLFAAIQNFPADRGEWHFSHYRHNRNVTDPSFAGDGSTFGPMPAFTAADNELLRAEALLRLGRPGDARQIINAGTRITRGQLPPLIAAADEETIERAIFYERAIELLGTSPMGLWFDRRRAGPRLDHLDVDALGGLQTGTPAHLPVPASELRIHKMEPYNFGGAGDPEGVVRN